MAKDDNEQAEEEVLPQVVDDDEVMGVNDGGPQNLAVALNGVVEIDNDNEPAPENVPTPGVSTTTVLSSKWGHEGIMLSTSTKQSQQQGQIGRSS